MYWDMVSDLYDLVTWVSRTRDQLGPVSQKIMLKRVSMNFRPNAKLQYQNYIDVHVSSEPLGINTGPNNDQIFLGLLYHKQELFSET